MYLPKTKGWHLPRVRARDAFYTKLEQQRASGN